MASLTLIQAVRDALMTEMTRDERVVWMGTLAKGGEASSADLKGLLEEFGEKRVMNSSLDQNGAVGLALGMAMNGFRPVSELSLRDSNPPFLDQIATQVARIRARKEDSCPLVIRSSYRNSHACFDFARSLGFKVIVPSNPYDAKGLLISAIRDEDPVLFLEPEDLDSSSRGEVPEEAYTVELGRALVIRPGRDATLIAWGNLIPVCMNAAEILAQRGIDCEVIDIRSLVPLDEATILESVRKTGRVVIVQAAPKSGGVGAELSALIAEQALLYLEAPVVRVTGLDTPFPYAPERVYIPDSERVALAVEKVKNF